MQEKFKNEEVIAAYMQGKTIQVKGLSSGEWEDYKVSYNGPFGPWYCNERYEWRVKPEKLTGWYRVALLKSGSTVTVNHMYSSEEDTEKFTNFVRWLTPRMNYTYEKE